MDRMRNLQLLLAAALVASIAACSAPRVQTTRLGSADLVAMTDAMAQSILASETLTGSPAAPSPVVIVIDRAVNRTSDVIPQRELWGFLARLQAQLAESPELRQRQIRFVLPAERAAELNVREGFDERGRIPPTHALTATFYSVSTASRQSRTDAYLCHFLIIDLHTDALAWQDRYEVKYAVMRNRLD
jgi:hypothetical protein